MSFLNKINSDFLTSRVTRLGRKAISEGNFNIQYFQIGDSEYDYNFDSYDGLNGRLTQLIMSPMDGDIHIKSPYLLNSTQGINYGVPVRQSTTTQLKEPLGPAGFTSNYKLYNSETIDGVSVECLVKEIDISKIDGTNILSISGATEYTNSLYITILFNTRLNGLTHVITGISQSLVYKIVSISQNEIILDRPMPDLSSEIGYVQVIANKCPIEYPTYYDSNVFCPPSPRNPLEQMDPWTIDIVWTEKLAGLDSSSFVGNLNEDLSGYTGTLLSSAKNYFGYTKSDAQEFIDFTGGTISTYTSYVNSFNETIFLPSEEQRVIAILHYSESGDLLYDENRSFKYDDFISHDTTEDYEVDSELVSDVDYFEVYIPFLYYHRNTSNMIGAKFHIDTTDYYIKSTKNLKPNINQIKFRYLLDENNYRVGKVFPYKKIIVFDDQEIVAALDYKSNRKWTLPAPKYIPLPSDLPNITTETPLIQSGETAWVTYLFESTVDQAFNGLHCNYYGKITATTDNNIGFKFNTNEFKYLSNTSYLNGYVANKMYALVQVTQNNLSPSPNAWKIIEITNQIPNHTSGQLINKTNLTGFQFIITGDMYDDADFYDVEEFLGVLPSDTQTTLPQFGDTQPFPGSIRLTRATELQVMNFLVNLPTEQFTTTQNTTYTAGKQKRITEIGLLNDRKELMVIAKISKPIIRNGNQVFSIQIDF